MKKKSLQCVVSWIAPGLACSVASAGELTATIEIPRLNVSEYHRPYVAAWIETPGRDVAANLAVWYDVEMRGGEGETWLKDLRQWWRKSGRSLDLPIDGVSGPTRPVGTHDMSFAVSDEPLASLADGEYFFVVEAAREVGGRELIRVPFNWSSSAQTDASVNGERELGAITLKIENR